MFIGQSLIILSKYSAYCQREHPVFSQLYQSIMTSG